MLIKSKIQQDPLCEVLSTENMSLQIVPLESERRIMTLKPMEEKIFHGDCKLICIEGQAEIINPLPGDIILIDDVNNRANEVKKYYVDGMIFGMRAKRKPVKFSLQRPHKWK